MRYARQRERQLVQRRSKDRQRRRETESVQNAGEKVWHNVQDDTSVYVRQKICGNCHTHHIKKTAIEKKCFRKMKGILLVLSGGFGGGGDLTHRYSMPSD